MGITAREDKVIKALDLVSFFISFLDLFNYVNTLSRLRVNYQLLTCCDREHLSFSFNSIYGPSLEQKNSLETTE